MGAGEALRNATRTVVGLVGNTVYRIPQTASYNERGFNSPTAGTTATLVAATTNNRFPKFLKQIIGDVKAGDLIIYVKDTDTVATDYLVQELKPIYVKDILVVTVCTLYKDNS